MIREQVSFLKNRYPGRLNGQCLPAVGNRLPPPNAGKDELNMSVISIDTFGGAGVTIGITFSTTFALAF